MDLENYDLSVSVVIFIIALIVFIVIILIFMIIMIVSLWYRMEGAAWQEATAASICLFISLFVRSFAYIGCLFVLLSLSSLSL